MRHRSAPLLGLALTTSLFGATSAAQCPPMAGTIPGTGSSVFTIDTPVATFYVEDRDATHLDNDGGGGLWIYEESNAEPALQRGGSWWVNWPLPRVGQINIGAVSDGTPLLTLFPEFFGAATCTQCERIGVQDYCVESFNPDTLRF